MSLESATFINDFVATNPVVGDNVSQGDDHLRLIKAVLKGTLPNLTRAYYLEQDRVDLASATTPDLSTPASNYINITGTTQIDGFATEPAGFVRLLRFNAVLTLNYNATSLILPTGDDIITAAGDHAWAVSRGSGNWTIFAYERASGIALAAIPVANPGFGTITGIAAAATVDLGTAASHYINVTGAATITSFGSSASTATPVYLVRFAGDSAITHSANIALPNSTDLKFHDNDHILVRYGGGGTWQVIGLFRNTTLGDCGEVNGLTMSNFSGAPNTQITATVSGRSVLQSPFGESIVVAPASGMIVNSAVNGVNGLDVGSLSPNTWYHVWMISSGPGAAPGLLLSLSATAPTMPSGIIYKHRLGAFLTGVSSTFHRIRYNGNFAQYVPVSGSVTTVFPVMLGAGGGSFPVTIPTGAFIPPTAVRIRGVISSSSTSGAAKIAANSFLAMMSMQTSTSNTAMCCYFDLALEGTDVFGETGNGSSITCVGWVDSTKAN